MRSVKDMSEAEYALGVNCGITLAGIKPASLFTVKKSLIKNISLYGKNFDKKGFSFKYLKSSGDRILVYIYHRDRLKKILDDEETKKFLYGAGYNYDTVEEALTELIKRLRTAEKFPHEIGVFLGYALEDVKGFIRSPMDGVYFTGYWKVYAHAEEKKRQFARYRMCSKNITDKLKNGESLLEIFKAQTA